MNCYIAAKGQKAARIRGYLLGLMLLPLMAVGQTATEANPPAPGFDLAGSDPRAVRIADEVMQALGGRTAWDNTRYITWKFFGKRRHIWDKWTGDIRVEDGKGLVVVMNLNTRKGRAWQNGQEITHPDSLQTKLQFAYEAWVNDSYWMFMPYKLKDTGVTLKYLGEGKTQDGRRADILQLTFKGVGVTPQNKYRVYVDKQTRLVMQWDFFRNAGDTEPLFSTPWANWKRYGNVLLSNDRGKRKHSDIAVFQELPESVFRKPEPLKIEELLPQ